MMVTIISDVLSGVPAAGLAAGVDGAGPEPTLGGSQVWWSDQQENGGNINMWWMLMFLIHG